MQPANEALRHVRIDRPPSCPYWTIPFPQATLSSVHRTWRKFDNAYMRPMFGGRGFVPHLSFVVSGETLGDAKEMRDVMKRWMPPHYQC